MNVLVNVFHPDIDASSVNSTWIEKLKKLNDVTLNLQYTNYPDWQFDLKREQQLLEGHQLIVFQFPFLWYSVPPLLKKWFDEVLAYGWAYGSGGDALKGKSVMAAISAGCSEESYQAGGENVCSMSELLKPVQLTFELTQMQYQVPYVFHSAAGATQREISTSADEYCSRLAAIQQLG